MELLIKYHNDITLIEQKNNSDWIDLRAAEDSTLFPGEYKLISLGVSIQLPDGFEAHIVPRSSTYKNFGIIQTNHQGVIDESYCGDEDIWKYPALNPGSYKVFIPKDSRICQFRIMRKQPKLEFKVVNSLDNNNNRSGFGSTGVN